MAIILPRNFIHTLYFVQETGIYEQIIRESVDERQYAGTHRSLLGQCRDEAFGPTAYGTAYVTLRGRHAPTRQYEGAQRLQLCVEAVDVCFEFRYVRLADGARHCLALGAGHGQVGAHVEQTRLYPSYGASLMLGCGFQHAVKQSQMGAKLVDSAIGIDAGTAFFDTASADERGGAVIASAGI